MAEDTGAGISQKVESVEGGAVAGVVRSSADVHIALNRIADVSERELGQIEALAHQVEGLTDVVSELRRALIGNKDYDQPGLVQRVANMTASDRRRERIQLINTAVLATIAIGQLVHTVAIWYLYRLVWWSG